MTKQLTLESTPAFLVEIGERLSRIEKLLFERQAPVEDSEKPMNIEEAASFLGLEKKTLYSLVHKKAIRFYKPGKNLHFFKKDLLAWLLSGDSANEQERKAMDEKQFLQANKKRGGKL